MTNSSIISRIIEHNKHFVAAEEGTAFRRDSKPKEKLAIVTCMDNRLITMLTAALGLDNGDANIIKIAGAEIESPYGDAMRSLLVAIYELDVNEIMIVAHTECGVQYLNGTELKELMVKAGIGEQSIQQANSEIDLDAWLQGFGDTEASVRKSVEIVKTHPLVPAAINISGFIIDTQTGELTPVD